jgi:hypothetical protein
MDNNNGGLLGSLLGTAGLPNIKVEVTDDSLLKIFSGVALVGFLLITCWVIGRKL